MHFILMLSLKNQQKKTRIRWRVSGGEGYGGKKRERWRINSPARCRCADSGKLERSPPSLELPGPTERHELIIGVLHTVTFGFLYPPFSFTCSDDTYGFTDDTNNWNLKRKRDESGKRNSVFVRQKQFSYRIPQKFEKVPAFPWPPGGWLCARRFLRQN